MKSKTFYSLVVCYRLFACLILNFAPCILYYHNFLLYLLDYLYNA